MIILLCSGVEDYKSGMGAQGWNIIDSILYFTVIPASIWINRENYKYIVLQNKARGPFFPSQFDLGQEKLKLIKKDNKKMKIDKGIILLKTTILNCGCLLRTVWIFSIWIALTFCVFFSLWITLTLYHLI